MHVTTERNAATTATSFTTLLIGILHHTDAGLIKMLARSSLRAARSVNSVGSRTATVGRDTSFPSADSSINGRKDGMIS